MLAASATSSAFLAAGNAHAALHGAAAAAESMDSRITLWIPDFPDFAEFWIPEPLRCHAAAAAAATAPVSAPLCCHAATATAATEPVSAPLRCCANDAAADSVSA